MPIFWFEKTILVLASDFLCLVIADINAGNPRREVFSTYNPRFDSVDTTALQSEHRARMSEDFYPTGNQLSRSISSSPSLHGGRGATPSEGGRPSDLSALAGGGRHSNFHLCAAP